MTPLCSHKTQTGLDLSTACFISNLEKKLLATEKLILSICIVQCSKVIILCWKWYSNVILIQNKLPTVLWVLWSYNHERFKLGLVMLITYFHFQISKSHIFQYFIGYWSILIFRKIIPMRQYWLLTIFQTKRQSYLYLELQILYGLKQKNFPLIWLLLQLYR